MSWAVSAMAVLSAFSPAGGHGPDADFDIPRCAAPFDQLVAREVFSKYPTPVPARAIRPAAPDVRRGQPRLYRTVIREEAKTGPNFADHYTVIGIGCGAATVCPAIVDARTGKVFFPPEIAEVEALLVDTGDVDVEPLNYRRDSRLIIIIGKRNEDPKTEGVSYYLWHSGRLKIIRFIPRLKLCGGG